MNYLKEVLIVQSGEVVESFVLFSFCLEFTSSLYKLVQSELHVRSS